MCASIRIRNRSLPGGPTEDMINRARLPEPRRRRDGWLEVVLGNFYTGDGIDGKMTICLRDFNSHHKSGLIVERIEVRPN
jgi:Phloem protein 2